MNIYNVLQPIFSTGMSSGAYSYDDTVPKMLAYK